MGANRWAAMARGKKMVRRPLDDYETPEEVTRALFQFMTLRRGSSVLEPAAGSGRMVRVLRKMGYHVETADIKRGRDFLRRTARHRGHCVTNPPYRGGLAEAFARQALALCDGRVAMLVQSDFVWGKGRASGMYLDGLRPDLVVVIPWRIAFFVGARKRTRSQFFSHCWVVWPARAFRAANASTRVEWATREMTT